MDFELRPATPEDDEFLEQLFADARAFEFAPLGLPAPALASLMKMQFKAQRAGYATQFPAAESSIVWAGAFPVGRVLLHQTTAELRLIDIALLTACRNYGIGTRLIETLQQRAHAHGLPLRLSVRHGNPAVHLYERLGFLAAGPAGNGGMDAEMEWSARQSTPPAPVVPPQVDTRIEPGATWAYFRSVQGETVAVRDAQGTICELTLVSVDLAAPPQASTLMGGDSFSLVFEGAETSPLRQGIHALNFRGELEIEIFLVPIRRKPGLLVYEAIFNRTLPVA